MEGPSAIPRGRDEEVGDGFQDNLGKRLRDGFAHLLASDWID